MDDKQRYDRWKLSAPPDGEPDDEMRCVNCDRPLSYFCGMDGVPEHQFCKVCMDIVYDMDGNPWPHFTD